MPIFQVQIQPGVNLEQTISLNETSWYATNLIRFWQGLPQPIGGWLKLFPDQLVGTPRAIWTWRDIRNVEWVAIGTTEKLYAYGLNVLHDITPSSTLINFLPNSSGAQGPYGISTTNSSTTVSVVTPYNSLVNGQQVTFQTQVAVGGIIIFGTYVVSNVNNQYNSGSFDITATSAVFTSYSDTVPVISAAIGSVVINVGLEDHGEIVGNTFNIDVPVTVGGVTLSGAYIVQAVIDANNFNINAASAATSTETVTMNDGQIQLTFNNVSGGSGVISATNWSMTNWGENLYVCNANGQLYGWSPENVTRAATIISNSPAPNGGIFTSMPYQFVVAWGSSIQGVQNPLLVQWSDQSNPAVWAPSVTNQAGNLIIPTGSRIVGAAQLPQQALIFTDVDVYSMQYLGSTLVFGFNQIAAGCGLIAQHAVGVLNDIPYWMSQGQFFALTGSGVTPLVCTVWDYIFQNLDQSNISKIFCATNSTFNEISWYFPVAGGSGECSAYVKFNITTAVWDYGTLDRVCWVDRTVAFQPLGCSAEGYTYQHETGETADGSPMDSWAQTGTFMVSGFARDRGVMYSEGDEIAFVDWMWPDFKYGQFTTPTETTVNMTIYGQRFPNDTPVTYGPYPMTNLSAPVNLRIRARQLSVKFDATSFWRLGSLRYRAAPDGRL